MNKTPQGQVEYETLEEMRALRRELLDVATDWRSGGLTREQAKAFMDEYRTIVRETISFMNAAGPAGTFEDRLTRAIEDWKGLMDS